MMMKTLPTHNIHLPTFAVLLLMLCAASAWAEGTLTHLSGPVSVQTADGKTVPGTAGLKVNVGDTVITGALGYARMEMTDGGEMVLRPDSRLKLEKYQFTKEKPADDNFVFSMLKGGLRTVTGLIGKRGNKDAYSAQTPTATIGIRGTQYDMRVCQANCGSLADGTYLAVRFGSVQTSNAQGTLAVAAGQAAHVPPQRAPVMLPRDPGIGFTPPAVIPKLDEKKKIKAAETAAAAAAPAPSTKATQATSSSGSTGQAAESTKSSPSSQSSSQSSDKPADEKAAATGSSSATTGTATASGTSSSATTADSSSASTGTGGASNNAAPAAAPTPAPTPPAASGPECSVQ
jgi:hypothetical protein